MIATVDSTAGIQFLVNADTAQSGCGMATMQGMLTTLFFEKLSNWRKNLKKLFRQKISIFQSKVTEQIQQ